MQNPAPLSKFPLISPGLLIGGQGSRPPKQPQKSSCNIFRGPLGFRHYPARLQIRSQFKNVKGF